MRRSLVTAHLWLGLILGLFWAVQGLTGALLVFHREADRLSQVAIPAGPMTSMDNVVANAGAYVGQPIEMVTIADRRGDLLNVHFRDADGPRQLLVAAPTAAPIGVRDYDPATPFQGSASRWLYLLHESLLLHDQGETIVGISGLFLFSTLLLGLWIGWPQRGRWREVFAARRWRTTRIRLYGWHRMLGLLAGAMLVITIPGGIWMIFAAELRPAVARIAPHELPYRAIVVPRLGPMIAPQAALDRAREQFPDAAFVRVVLPTAISPVYTIRLRQPHETRIWSGVTMVTIDGATGRTLHIYDPLRAPLSNRLADAAFSVHSAEIGGLAGRLLLMLAGLMLPVLYITGIWSWLRHRRKRPASSSPA